MNALHLARAADPMTSHVADENVHKFANGQYERIRAAIAVCLQICPAKGATAAEIAGEASLSIEQVCRRLPELRKAGIVQVLQHDDGADLIRGGFRCWGLV
jgi:hypothetical protein